MSLPPPWKADETIGVIRSGQAWVYAAFHPDLEGRYAVKVLHRQNGKDRFIREVEATRKLAEFGLPVPEIVVSELSGDMPYFAMRWYADGSLQQICERDRADDEGVVEDLDRLFQVGEALQALHAADTAHRDLKPENVLLDGDNVILADLGLCLALEGDQRLTETREPVGSRNYIPPENEAGINETVDQRPGDCYAFAKLVWAVKA